MAKKLDIQEQQKTQMLIASGRTVNSTAKTLKRSPHTIKKYIDEPEVHELIEAKRQALAGKYEELADRLITGITKENIEKLNPYQRVLSSGIAIDKGNLLRGLSRDDRLQPRINIIINDPTTSVKIEAVEDGE